MKNNQLLINKINEALNYIQEQDEKLNPVLEYLSNCMLENKELLSPKECFDYYLQLREQKVNSILLLSKLKEVLDYDD